MTSFERARNRSLLAACLQQVFAEVSSLLPGLETGAFMYIIVDVYTFLVFLEFLEYSYIYICIHILIKLQLHVYIYIYVRTYIYIWSIHAYVTTIVMSNINIYTCNPVIHFLCTRNCRLSSDCLVAYCSNGASCWALGVWLPKDSKGWWQGPFSQCMNSILI